MQGLWIATHQRSNRLLGHVASCTEITFFSQDTRNTCIAESAREARGKRSVKCQGWEGGREFVFYYSNDFINQRFNKSPATVFYLWRGRRITNLDVCNFKSVQCSAILKNLVHLMKNAIYYININEIPGELSRKNVISSHVKITCYFHM